MSNEWKTLRVVVEVRVPAKPRIAISDLKYQVEMALQDCWQKAIPLPRDRAGCHYAKPHVKDFGRLARHVFAAMRAPNKPRFGFELIVLRGLSLLMAYVTAGRLSRRGAAELRSWSQDATDYLGLPTELDPDAKD